ncbi:hypothetical protein ACGFJC_47630 [Nonomuraea fuscirosea]|uniref:hypothetical protein n=1 Tax=Nonomuraea fuscirosea TaxID=1291556 RepID=UPI003719A3CF
MVIRWVIDRAECRHCEELIVLLSERDGTRVRRMFWAHSPREGGPRLVHCWDPYGIVPAPQAEPMPQVRARWRRLVRLIRGRW